MDFEEYCGGPLYNESETWNTEEPDLSFCMHNTFLIWIPSIFIAVATPMEIRRILTSRNRGIGLSFVNVPKYVCYAVLLLVNVWDFIVVMTSSSSSSELPLSVYVNPFLLTVVQSLSLFLHILSLKMGVVASATQFLYFLISASLSAVTFRSALLNPDQLPVVTNGVRMGVLTALCLLNCVADKKPSVIDGRLKDQRRPVPSIWSSFAYNATYEWCTSLLWKGYRKPLVEEDLWDVHPDHSCSGVRPDFDRHFMPEKFSDDVNDIHNNMEKNSGVLLALGKTFGLLYLVATLYKVVSDVFNVAAPQVLKLMIAYVQSMSVSTSSGEFLWRGYFYTFLLFLLSQLATFVQSYYFELSMVVAMHMRTALQSVLYRKSLVISSSSRKDSTTGQIVNLMSVDVQRFIDLVPYLNVLATGPIQVGVSLFFLYQELGWSLLAGIAVLIISLPLNAVFASIMRKYYIVTMKSKDNRIKLMTEVLAGIKVLKLYGWENSFSNQILEIRATEIRWMRKSAILMSFINFIWTSVPFLVSVASFAAFVLLGDEPLTAEKAFVTISYLNILRFPMIILPFVISSLVQIKVSIDRLNDFLRSDELDRTAVQRSRQTAINGQEDAIIIDNATFVWDKDEENNKKSAKDNKGFVKEDNDNHNDNDNDNGKQFVLADIDLRVRAGSLTAVVGAVGTGKSSLVSAMLGEMIKTEGHVGVKASSVAFVPQTAWMKNASLEENIKLASPRSSDGDSQFYKHVIEACALTPDLAILPGGDQTEIGEKGINLSGGQKQRISLARACYSDADVYLLDDPLSAVDSHVGKHIFEHVVGDNGLLHEKTRVLVTHNITFLPKTDHIVVMREGRVSEQGTYRELLAKKGAFAAFLLEYMAEHEEDEKAEQEEDTLEEEDEEEEELMEELKHQLLDGEQHTEEGRRAAATLITRRMSSVESEDGAHPRHRRRRTSSIVSTLSEKQKDKGRVMEKKMQETNGAEKSKLVEAETSETGSVKPEVYFYYMRTLGIGNVCFIVLMQALYQALQVSTNFWLTFWTDRTIEAVDNENLYLAGYALLGLLQSVANLAQGITFMMAALKGSAEMHRRMLERILKAPMAFFDTTPTGRIVNRFAKDVDSCDTVLASAISTLLATGTRFLGTMIVLVIVVPWLVLLVVPVIVIFVFMQSVYVSSSRQLKRLESVSRSPIYSHFGETLNGVFTIRAFGLQTDFVHEFENKVDKSIKCYYPSIMANRWLSVRLESIGNLITLGAALFAMLNPTDISPGEIGLLLTYSLTVTVALTWTVRSIADVETNIVAVERLREYTLEVDQERPWVMENVDKKLTSWPSEGQVRFENYSMRYRPGLELVLRGITCTIGGGQKVGIVGRTGAGKSSLTTALFRLVEGVEGDIVIDEQPISKLGLHTIRKRITIIPQDAVIFSGSLRSNLDPFEEHTDSELWEALELAHLKDFVSDLSGALNHEIAEGGDNLSVGQKQLLCLARAVLRRCKVLVLDEATAAVDLETDDLIQKTIRSHFRDATVLTIAHRLNTILDYDKIIVLDKGRIVEFQDPQTLINDQASIFHSMIRDANLLPNNNDKQ